MNIKNNTLTILGAKRSGLALCKLITQKGGYVKISELCQQEDLSDEFLRWIKENDVECEFQGHTKDFVIDSDMIVISPGIPQNAEPLAWAKEERIPILGEIEFAFQYVKKPVVAVTGSNGKTTVVTLIAEVLKKAGLNARLCGNVGHAFSNEVISDDEIDYYVLEISSFQLESMVHRDDIHYKRQHLNGFRPAIAVMLNFSENHLDRHQDMNEYLQAKWRIFENQVESDHAVVNAQSDFSEELINKINAQIHLFNQDTKTSANPNHLAVNTVGEILNIDKEIVSDVLASFKGVEHRLEWVRTIAGIDFINDSKATTAEASRWALTNLNGPIMMICGGRDKNIDFTVLNDLVKSKVKQIFVYGEAKDKIAKSFKDIVGVESCDALKSAVQKAREQASPGDSVVLSPMCASFDMFRDYEERGTIFKQIVEELK